VYQFDFKLFRRLLSAYKSINKMMVTMWRLDSRVVGGMEEAEGVLVAEFLLSLTHLHQG
jgi:hypothetical protein